jgi:hypothetical protein
VVKLYGALGWHLSDVKCRLKRQGLISLSTCLRVARGCGCVSCKSAEAPAGAQCARQDTLQAMPSLRSPRSRARLAAALRARLWRHPRRLSALRACSPRALARRPSHELWRRLPAPPYARAAQYAIWEEGQKDFRRARSVWERTLDVTYTNASVWLKYAEMEMRHRFINHARNVWDRAVSLLPRVDQLWRAPPAGLA